MLQVFDFLKVWFCLFSCFCPHLHIVLKTLVSAKSKLTYDVSMFFLKSESNLHLPIQFLEGADARCLTLRPYFYPMSVTFWDGQIRGNSEMFLFLLQNPQWSPMMKSRTMYITKGKIFNFFILNGAYRNFYGNLNWSLKKENKSKYYAKIDSKR